MSDLSISLFCNMLRVGIYPIVATIYIFIFGGCTTQPGTITERFFLKTNASMLTDSRQRAITNIDIKDTSRPGLVDPRRIVCAEPSPDVAIALANSFGFGISIFSKGSGSLTGAQAEGMAQLAERTVTVQLLRDQMYRACEAYANGAITGTTYNLIMSKNNDAMITLMLGETAGGAFGRNLAAIGAGSSSEVKSTLEELYEIRNQLDKAEQDVKEADKKVKVAEEKVEDKKEIKEQDDAKTGDNTVSDEKKQENAEEVEKAEQELAAAEANREQMKKRKADVSSKSQAQVDKLIGAGSIEHSALRAGF